MALDLTDPELARGCERLAPYARHLLESAGLLALGMHSDSVGIEHLLCAMMDDEESAAHRVALHAFADPESIGVETMALAEGILLVGSKRTLPFSVHAVEALRAARVRAARQAGDAVECEHLVGAALEAVTPDLRESLEQAGLSFPPEGPVQGGGGVSIEGPLFHDFSEDAKRALASAARFADRAGERSIGPAQVLLGCLHVDEDLERELGLGADRAVLLVRGRTADPTPAPDRLLPADEGLRALLARVAEGTDSLALLAGIQGAGRGEMAAILTRHRVTTALLERARPAFEDPAPPPPAA